jgi:hypothetical protein
LRARIRRHSSCATQIIHCVAKFCNIDQLGAGNIIVDLELNSGIEGFGSNLEVSSSLKFWHKSGTAVPRLGTNSFLFFCLALNMSTVTAKKQFTLVFVLDEPNQKVIIVVRIYFLVIQCLVRTPSFFDTALCVNRSFLA